MGQLDLLRRVTELEAENERLREEVARLMADNDRWQEERKAIALGSATHLWRNTADKARADLKKIQDGHKCTQPTHWDEPNPCPMCIKDLEDKLAQAERERAIQHVCTHCGYVAATQYGEELRAEVERLWAKVAAIIRWPNDGPVPTEDNILPALTGLLASIPAYQAEVKRWKERVTTLETEEKWEALKQAEAALAQAKRERDAFKRTAEQMEVDYETYLRLHTEARAEVERLKGELNEAKEEVRRQVEVRVLDQGRHHVDLQEAPGQIVPESLCSCGETLRELEADLARVRAALETAANRLDIAASVIRSGAEFTRWAAEARAVSLWRAGDE